MWSSAVRAADQSGAMSTAISVAPAACNAVDFGLAEVAGGEGNDLQGRWVAPCGCDVLAKSAHIVAEAMATER